VVKQAVTIGNRPGNPTTEIKTYPLGEPEVDEQAEIIVSWARLYSPRGQRIFIELPKRLAELGWPVVWYKAGTHHSLAIYCPAGRALAVRDDVARIIAEVM